LVQWLPEVFQMVYENKLYPEECRKQAALVARKVYCHLGSYEDSLTYALGAGELFNTEDSKNQYVGTIIAMGPRSSARRSSTSGRRSTTAPPWR